MEPDALLALIEKHLALTDCTETKFGVDALGDPNFVKDLRAGREPRRKTVQKVRDFIQVRGRGSNRTIGSTRSAPPSEAA